MTPSHATTGVAPNNFLTSCGKPLFFRAANSQDDALTSAANRLGESVRAWVRAVGGMQKEALLVSSRTGAAWRLASDEGDYLMGTDAAPCPLSFLTTGMVISFMTEILALARTRPVNIQGIRLTQDNYYTMQGSAIRGTMIGGALPVDLIAAIDSDSSPDATLQLVQEAVNAAAISDLVRRPLNNLFSLTHNRAQVSVGRVSALPGVAIEDLGTRFDQATPEPAGAELVTKRGMTPRTGETTSSAGSSLAAEQSRQLHVRGICTLRADGLIEVEQHLFNPHGSIFSFVADPENLRAPSPATYISAGIAFCFMTQFGRYAAIARKPLKSYSVVQDTHFSLGRERGRMDAVETHVHLETGESDEFARTCLDMSEQTCFLHALCRAALDVRVTLASLS